MRYTKNHVDYLFKIFDSKNTGHINGYHIHAVTCELGLDMDRSDVQDLLAKCSASGSFITKEEFTKLVTSQVQEDSQKDEDEGTELESDQDGY